MFDTKSLFLVDWLACALSEIIILDTEAHIEYFKRRFKLTKSNYIRAFVGTTEDIFYPNLSSGKEQKFIIHFHGSNIPLQGVGKIIEAARMLLEYPDIKFRIIGPFKNLPLEKNIEFISPVSIGELGVYLNKSDLVLGIFGDTAKTDMVIPNKIYEAIAVGKPVITKGTAAIKELFSHGKDIFLCDGSVDSIVDSIKLLRNNQDMQNLLSNNGRELFLKKLTPKLIVERLIIDLSN
jgi:glycosyltransferase involved in cell wall biosynthesis